MQKKFLSSNSFSVSMQNLAVFIDPRQKAILSLSTKSRRKQVSKKRFQEQQRKRLKQVNKGKKQCAILNENFLHSTNDENLQFCQR